MEAKALAAVIAACVLGGLHSDCVTATARRDSSGHWSPVAGGSGC